MFRLFLFLFAAMVLSGCSSFEPQVSIAPWKGGKCAAVALTFDDWTPGHPAIVVPELQRRELVATFNVITGNVSDWDPLRTAVALGNEVANHTVTHPHPCDSALFYDREVLAAKQRIEAEIPSQRSLTFAYPYGELTDSLRLYLQRQGYVAARGVQSPSTADYLYPRAAGYDYFDTKSFSVMTETTLADYLAQLDSVKQGGGMLTFLYHSVYSGEVKDFSYAWVVDTTFRKQLDALQRYDFWVATYADMITYHRLRGASKIEKVEQNGSRFTFRLVCDEAAASDAPLTVLVRLASLENIIVKQAGAELPYVALSDGQLMFDALPNGGVITIEKI